MVQVDLFEEAIVLILSEIDFLRYLYDGLYDCYVC